MIQNSNEERELKNSNSLQKTTNKKNNLNHYKSFSLSNKELFLFQFICTPYYKFRNKIISPFSKKTIFFNKPLGWFFAIIPLISVPIVLSIIAWSAFGQCPEEFPNILYMITIALVTKNSILTFLTGIGFDTQILLHKVSAYVLYVTGFIHGLHYVLVQKIIGQTFIGIGFFACIVLASFVGVFFKCFFKKYYEIFFFLHIFFFIASVVMGLLHHAKGPLIGVIIWGVDKLIEIIITHFVYKKGTKNCKVMLLSDDVINIKFDKKKGNFNYKPGQFGKIIVPSVTPFELHPFSFESSPYEKEVSIMIKVCGNWTRELKKVYLKKLEKKKNIKNNLILSKKKTNSEKNDENGTENLEIKNSFKTVNNLKNNILLENQINLPIYMTGPLGNAMINLDDEEFETLMFVSGGIGITPMQSFAKTLLYEIKSGRKIKKIVFIWSGRNEDFIDNCVNVDKTYEKLFLNENDKKDFFEIFLHLTKNQNLDFLNQKEDFSELRKNSIFLKRPNYESHFKNMNDFCYQNNVKKFGVMTCGPKKMMDSVISLCHKFDGLNKVAIRFHYETFGFLDDLF